MKNKAIIIDLDGVVIDSPHQKLPSKELRQIIAKLKDSYYFCAATGRVWTFAKSILRALSLTDPCIISAGTQIYDPLTGHILWQKTISNKSLFDVLSLLKQYPYYKLLANDLTEKDYFYGGVRPQDFLAKEPVYVLNQVFVPSRVAIEICAKLHKIKGITCVMATAQKPGCKDLHIINSDATKKQAVAELLQRIGVKKSNTIGIGDGLNDIDLFKAVKYKVAMGNAVTELKRMADVVIGSVKNDGLTDYLKSLI